MSDSYFEMVKFFHKKYGLHIEENPIDFSHEADEYQSLFFLRKSLHTEEWNELEEAWLDEDLVQYADALCDLIYVLCGTAVSFGIPLDECFAEVQRSNMSKLDSDGNPIVRADGKILKGPDFSPPDLHTVIYGDRTS
jgi:predicted HAD superfamily Cof-like phosphohydrolase